MYIYSNVRSGFDEKGSDGSYLSKQQTCTSRKDENDIVERFFSCEELLYFDSSHVCVNFSSLPLVDYNQAYCRRKMLVQQYEKMQVDMLVITRRSILGSVCTMK